MQNIVVKHIHRNGLTFRLSLVYSEYKKAYSTLILEHLGKYKAVTEINGYFLDMYSKKGQLMGWAALNESIEKDITRWIKNYN